MLEKSMIVKLLNEHNLEFLCLIGDCTGLSESALVKMPHCWKSNVTAQLFSVKYVINKGYFSEAFLFKPRGGPTERFKQKAEEKSII